MPLFFKKVISKPISPEARTLPNHCKSDEHNYPIINIKCEDEKKTTLISYLTKTFKKDNSNTHTADISALGGYKMEADTSKGIESDILSIEYIGKPTNLVKINKDPDVIQLVKSLPEGTICTFNSVKDSLFCKIPPTK
jgi:hypothetical protein